MVQRVLRMLPAAFVFAAVMAVSAAAATDTLVSSGSPSDRFPQNKQNEPSVAIDAAHPNVVAAGSNDEIDLQPCPAAAPTSGVRCPFTIGVGVSGIYFSLDGGQSWTQPTYQGWTARDCTAASCTPHYGDIGTVPNYYEAGLVSDGDPSLAFGPIGGANGKFSWANGSRLYYANLSENFSGVRSEQTFKGFEAVAVSYTDDIVGAMAGDNSAWSAPHIVTKQNAALFSDKEQVWADNAASSPHFGNVYVCNAAFRSQEISPYAVPEPIVFTRSTDGGNTWSSPVQLSPAVNNLVVTGRQGCTVRTDSAGVVYVFWEGNNPLTKADVQYMTRSFDGGVTFERPRAVANVVDVGAFDPAQFTYSIDGVNGVRTNSFPSVDIANGAPSGTDATDEIVMSWDDARAATPSPYSCCPGTINNDEVLVQSSTNQGASWSAPLDATDRSDHLPNFPAVAISPDGSSVYLTYMALAQPWQPDNASARLEQGVVRVGSADLSSWTTVLRGASGDARGSSANGLGSEFLGDYDYAAAMRTGDAMQSSTSMPSEFGVAVWNDVRQAADCPAVDAYREALTLYVEGQSSTPPTAPYPCTSTSLFGNSDIFGGQFVP